MIIIDYSQISMATAFMFKNELSSCTDNTSSLLKHSILYSILTIKKKFEKKFGDNVVISCDFGSHYWRKDVFGNYKSGRKETRDKSTMNWKLVFDTINELRAELDDNFNYKIMHVDGAESDDIIGVLAKWSQTNYIDKGFISDEIKPILIVSTDKDFIQLHKHDNITQWNPTTKKIIDKEKNVASFINCHIAKGDSGDYIPNCLSADNVFVDKIRQTPVSKKRLAEFAEIGIEACRTDTERRNWARNELLISFDKIPDNIYTAIVQEYEKEKPCYTREKLYNYFIKNKMKLLINEIESF